MHVRLLPGTDLKLSVVGMGCWAIGGEHWGTPVSEKTAISAIHAALDCGVTWFDTAPIYGWGRADILLAKALTGRDAIVATKVGARRGRDGHAHSDLSPEFLRTDVEASLRRLGRPTLDLLQIHWPCERHTPLEASLGALARMREEGLIRNVGVCNYDPRSLRRIMQHDPDVVSLQTPYSLVRREFEQALGPACASLGLGVLAYEGLCRGLLSGNYRTLHTFPATDMRRNDERFHGGRFVRAVKLVDDLEKIAHRLALPTAAIALGWAASQPGITAVIAGCKTPTQVRENVRAGRIIGKEKIVSVISRVSAHHPV